MAKGRKKLPTELKKIQGTLDKSRILKNEMQADLCIEIPTPPKWLSPLARDEWVKITTQLYNLNMLYHVDLMLIEVYCNEIALYKECEQELRKTGRVDEFFNGEGDVIRRQAKPFLKIKNDALANALKLATHVGLTPVARASISAPVTTNNTQINNYFE